MLYTGDCNMSVSKEMYSYSEEISKHETAPSVLKFYLHQNSSISVNITGGAHNIRYMIATNSLEVEAAKKSESCNKIGQPFDCDHNSTSNCFKKCERSAYYFVCFIHNRTENLAYNLTINKLSYDITEKVLCNSTEKYNTGRLSQCCKGSLSNAFSNPRCIYIQSSSNVTLFEPITLTSRAERYILALIFTSMAAVIVSLAIMTVLWRSILYKSRHNDRCNGVCILSLFQRQRGYRVLENHD